jgi:hypothetical protein
VRAGKKFICHLVYKSVAWFSDGKPACLVKSGVKGAEPVIMPIMEKMACPKAIEGKESFRNFETEQK